MQDFEVRVYRTTVPKVLSSIRPWIENPNSVVQNFRGCSTRWLPAYDIFVLRFWPKKTAVFGCLTNALAPPPIALESCLMAQMDRTV